VKPLLRELPLAIGVGVGLAIAWRWGWAFVFDGAVEGYHWDDYLGAAWMVVHRTDAGYPSFRQPLHGALVGHLGELWGSYADAGILWSSVGITLLIGAAALAGRALAGPAAGGAAAALVPMARITLTAPRWSNLYPLLAGTSSLSLAFAVATARWPSVPLALAAGTFGGIAWGVDPRGLAFAPAAGLLVLLGAARARSWLRRLALVAAFLCPLAIGPASVEALWLDGIERPEPIGQLRYQRQVFLRWATNSHRDTDMATACQDQDPRALPSLTAFQSDCARAMAGFNFHRVLPDHLPVPAGWAVAGAALCLLPRRRWKLSQSTESFLFFGVGLAPLLLLCWWMPYPERYLVQLSAIFSLLVPVGLVRALGLAAPGPRGAVVQALAAGVLVVMAWRADPTARLQETAVQASPREQLRAQVAAAARDHMGPGEPLLDCADLRTPLRWLPDVRPAPLMVSLDDARCQAWVTIAPTTTTAWLLLRDEGPPSGADGKPLRPEESGWTEAWHLDNIGLYRR
jgi:hypothetical protein